MAGFECADHRNHYGERVDLLTDTGHLAQLTADYRRIRELNLTTVREGIRWSVVEPRPYEYHWDSVARILEEGRAQGIQQLWDICHFGWPDDISPLHPHFVPRFVALCEAFVRFYRSRNQDSQLIVTPVNEVSFISWLCGEAGSAAPYCRRMGWDIKYHLCRAYIAGIKAMRAIDPSVIIMTTEPLVNMVPPLDATEEEIMLAQQEHELQYQTVDMLTGRSCPELGGAPELIDILGFNYYYNNQWVVPGMTFLPWANEGEDPRWRPLSDLLEEAWRRYDIPIALTETSHPGEHRPHWLHFITSACAQAISKGVPLKGICLYPVIDRPDWDHPQHWHHSGLWDNFSGAGPDAGRVLVTDYAAALAECQRLIAAVWHGHSQKVWEEALLAE